jgi:predicted membrane protein
MVGGGIVRKEVPMPATGSSRHTPRITLGIAAIIAGLLLTLRNLEIPGMDDVLEFWPLVLVALGLTMALRPRGVPGRGMGLCLAVVGAWLLLRNLGIVRGSLWDLWPLFLVFAGGSLVWHATRGGRESSATGDPGSYLSSCGCLSGAVQRSTSKAFRGADLTAVMGGCELDLTDAAIGEEEAIIDTFTLWGGIEIRVPPSWTVVNRVTPILGGVVDRTKSGSTDPKQQIVVRGLSIMGSVEIRN